MRLMLLNPNTSASITDLVAREAARHCRPGTEIVPVTGTLGGRYIATRVTYALAGHAALDAWARNADGIDGVLLACFGDPGLSAIRELSPVPVIGMVDAAFAAAGARRFSIVTGGALWEPMLREMALLAGVAGRLASIRTVAPSGAEIARDPDGSIASLAESCRRCVDQDGAQAVILGGAGLAGLVGRVAAAAGVALIDPLEASMAAIQDAVAAGPRDARRRAPGIEAIGLSPELAARIASG